MNLKIECPDCHRQFEIHEDLSGKTVECGACDKRFRVEDSVIVKEKKRVYPGEHHDALLDRLGRAPVKTAQPVNFQQANYASNARPDKALPAPAKYGIAAACGVLLLVGYAFVFFAGTQSNTAMFADVPMFRRMVLAAFVVLLGGGLIIYGAKNWRRAGVLLAVVLGAGMFGLVSVREVHTSPGLGGEDQAGGGFVAGGEGGQLAEEPENEEQDLSKQMRLNPLTEAVAQARQAGVEDADNSVVGIYIRGLRDSREQEVSEYLTRRLRIPKTQTPIFFPRGERDQLVVIERLATTYDEVYDAVTRLGEAKSRPELHLIMLDLNPEVFGEPGRDLFEKLIDPTNPAFFKRNLAEMEQVSLGRIQAAVTRLANVPEGTELLFQAEITRKLIELLQRERDEDLRVELGRALKKWGENDTAAAKKVLSMVQTWQAAGVSVPKAIVEFIVENNVDGAMNLVDRLWQKNPVLWRGEYRDLGSKAEPLLLTHVRGDDEGLKLGAIKVLHYVGTAKSIPVLQKVREAGNREFQIYVANALAAIRKRQK